MSSAVTAWNHPRADQARVWSALPYVKLDQEHGRKRCLDDLVRPSTGRAAAPLGVTPK